MKKFLRDTIETAIHGQPRYLDIERLPITLINLAHGASVITYLTKINWKPDYNYKKEKQNV